MAKGVKYTEEFVRGELAKENWDLIGDYKTTAKQIVIKHPNLLYGCECLYWWRHWIKGNRPTFRSVIDQQKYVENTLAEEGWVLVSAYKNSTEHISIRNINVFNGGVCKIQFYRWVFGERPVLTSLLDMESYLEALVKKEGWEFLKTYIVNKKRYIEVRNPRFFNSHICRIRYDAWIEGHRPNFNSLKDKNKFISDSITGEGWEVVKVISTDEVVVKNKEKFGDFEVITSWNRWVTGRRPSIHSVIQKTECMKSKFNDIGFEVVDKDWRYKNSYTCIRLRSVQTEKVYSLSYSRILSGKLPETPKYLISGRINSFLKHRKTFSITKMFPKEYWEELDRKFPFIPAGDHIDHITCLSFFGDSWEQVRIANDPRNLRLLPAKENISRGNRLRASELDKYNLWDIYHKAENPMGFELIEDRYDLAG